ncbi:tyrosyl-tRNA synthetase [Caloramator quimbayensis]|uniref:Tyrosine--tRNA ligase n=1 Tax=Caloramator quimbayensis TaxID=1147123 RepID=A0A1T4X795_9CLOT|nr:tyrosine--tRNA ligase [Caloramator quimbayensis]SKA84731.1 tyrosyl-tRNA synthetase [Caloramator quimbayensis]
MSVFDVLKERGFIAQLTHEDEIKEILDKEKVTFYIGFDPTADSLHVGHFLQLMVMSHMQKAGHRPIALLGGGTAMVGDPTGKTDMRKMLTKEEINHNAECFKKQMEKFIDFSDGKAIMANNADWLLNLNYIEFLREIGVHFSVNRMLTAESVKQRMERGLTFLEFNYMIMQGYDFLELNKRYGCVMQLGGDDQWSNIIAGVELIRKKESKPAFGMTFTLLTTSEGKKMGKTEKGAVWLDPEKTSPYDFYQYWRNIDDADVEKCLALLTFLPMDEVRRLGSLKDKEINEAKKVLAYEITKIVHGKDEAEKAKKAAEALFGSGGDLEHVPTSTISSSLIGSKLVDILFETSIVPSKAEAKRLIKQGGLYVNDEKITDIDAVADESMFKDGKMLVRKGKKTYNQIIIE